MLTKSIACSGCRLVRHRHGVGYERLPFIEVRVHPKATGQAMPWNVLLERTTVFEPATLTLAIRSWEGSIQCCSLRRRGLRPSLRPGGAAKSAP